MPKAFILRGVRFSLIGVFCTVLAYAIFAPLVYLGVPYLAANVVAWMACVLVSFVLNRHVTFQIRGRDGVSVQFKRFVAGAVSQLILASLGYWLLMSVLHLGPTLAFGLNLILTAGFMFVYLNAVAFRQ
jgi:putative flippase GtrA